jgi:hypothetical protein
MKNYKEKDGMLMIFRAMIMTSIALTVCWVGYRICKPAKPKQEVIVDKDLGYFILCTDKDGNTYRIR